jgi:small subunit ribosomal protein S6
MTLPAPTYDLVLLLDPQAEEETRAKIVADARAAIEAQGELLRHDQWGTRTLTYPIDRKAAAEYHLLQFHASAPELLAGLDRTLRITDDIMRFRIIKLKPGVPDAPDLLSVPSTERQAEPQTPVAVEVEVVQAEVEVIPAEAVAEIAAEPQAAPEPQVEPEVEAQAPAELAEPA